MGAEKKASWIPTAPLAADGAKHLQRPAPPLARLHTQAVHAGEARPHLAGALSMPLFHSSTYLFSEACAFDDIAYGRLNNTPNQQAVSRKLAALMGAEAAVVTPSGTAAIYAALSTALEPGDHVLVQREVYSGTRKIFTHLAKARGVTLHFVDVRQPESWPVIDAGCAKLFYCDALSNPTLIVPHYGAIVRHCRRHGLLSVVDNTVLGPVNFQPLALGFDLELHSASKSLNGHADVVAGVVAGQRERVEGIRRHLNAVGMCLDPQACFLLQRGLKTLVLRVERQCATAQRLATWLESRPAIAKVHYPGLASCPGHGLATRWLRTPGALVSFEPEGDATRAETILRRLQLVQIAPSFGGVESLACRPAETSHAGLPEALKRELGAVPNLIRLSVGLEALEALQADLEQALSST